MVELNCQPIKTYNNYTNQKLAFGCEQCDAKRAEATTDSVEVKSKQPEEKQETSEREFSFKNAATNFGKGLYDPIKKLISSPEAMATTAIAGYGIKRLSEKSSAFSIFAVTATGLFGAFNLGKGINKFIQSKDVESKENSFKDMGQGTVILGLSALPAPRALKLSGKEPPLLLPAPKSLNLKEPSLLTIRIEKHLTALGKCWSESGKMISSLLNTGKTGISKPVRGMSSAEAVSVDAGAEVPNILGQALNVAHTLITDPMSLFAFSANESGAVQAINKAASKLEK